MSAIIIKSDNQNTKILKELAKKLGADVLSINEDLYEDLALGLLMDRSKTGKTVSRGSIMKKLNEKWKLNSISPSKSLYGTYYTSKGGQYRKDQNLILSSFTECDEHELVHYFTAIKYPNKMQFFDEGLATYIGGSMGQDLNYHLKKLYNHFYRMNTDTTNIMKLPRIDQETDPAYILGGVIIKYTAETFGIQKALNLLIYSYKQNTPEEVIEKELGIPKDKLNSFLLEYIKKYSGN